MTKISAMDEVFHRVRATLDRAKDQFISGFLERDQLISGFLERDHVGVTRGILKNSAKEQTFYGENVAREHTNNAGRRFFDLLEVDIAERSLWACTTTGIKRHGPNLAHIRSERERLLRE